MPPSSWEGASLSPAVSTQQQRTEVLRDGVGRWRQLHCTFSLQLPVLLYGQLAYVMMYGQIYGCTAASPRASSSLAANTPFTYGTVRFLARTVFSTGFPVLYIEFCYYQITVSGRALKSTV
jgi:hypothetical protein